MIDKVLEVEGLEYRIGALPILDDISFSLHRGESLSIVGPNGAGKTTLLKCMNRILKRSDGSVRVLGRPVDRFRQAELAKIISYVPQAGRQALPYTVFEFVLMGRYPYFSPFSSVSLEDEKATRDALCLTGIDHLQSRMLETLSGGEFQKVLIAAALAQSSEIMLLDEPTTFLDPRHQTEIIQILRRTNREQGITMLTVTHDLNSAVLISEQILAIKDGRSVFQGPSAEIMNEKILRELYEQKFDFVAHPNMHRVLAVPRVSE